MKSTSLHNIFNFVIASMIAKIRITTEEEAKAALAERRRLAREQAEREAELERQRIVSSPLTYVLFFTKGRHIKQRFKFIL